VVLKTGAAERRKVVRSAAKARQHILSGAILAAVLQAPLAVAQQAAQTSTPAGTPVEARMTFDIPAQPLSSALTAFGIQSGYQIAVDQSLLAAQQSPGARGSFTPREALSRVLGDSGLVARFTDSRSVVLSKPPQGAGATVLPPVLVEGARTAPLTATMGNLPPEYAGGQVARGGRVGVLGNQDSMDVPFSMTSYTSQTIRDQGAATVGEVLANDPAVRTGYGFGNYSEMFVIRGFQLSGDDLSVDGLYGLAPRQIVTTEMYERVEVLRGATAFLNGVPPGGTGIGGSINLVPKRAGDTPLTSITGTFAPESQAGGHIDMGRRFGRDNAVGLRINAAHREGETSIEHEQRTMHMGSLGLDFRGDNTRVSLDLSSQRQRIDQGRPVVNVNAATVIPHVPDSKHNYAQTWSYSDLTDTSAQLRAEHDVSSNTTVFAALGARQMREDGDYASQTVTNGNTGASTASRLTVPREDTAESGTVGMNGDYFTGDVRHRLSLGAAAVHNINRNAFSSGAAQATNIYADQTLVRPVNSSISAGGFNTPPKVSETMFTSFFVSDTLGFFEETVLLTLGLREQRLRTQNYNRAGPQTSSINERELSPVIGLVYKPVPSVALYANRIEGLAQGPVASGSGITNAGEVFPPYVSTQYEVGAKYDSGKLGFGLAAFQTEQPLSLTENNVFKVEGEQRNQGVEFSFYGELVDGLRVLGGVTLTEATQMNTANDTNNGRDAIGVPRYQANLGLDWDVPGVKGLALSGRMLYTGTQYLNAANTQQIDSWTRFDAGARYATEVHQQPVTFRLFVENVTDLAYWASANGGYLTQGRPLTARLSATVDF
jgi:iron complex outermembrane receptor protein